MVDIDIGKIRIKKQTFNFEIKRRFNPIKNFQLIKRSRLEQIQQKLKQFISRKSVSAKAQGKKEGAGATNPPASRSGLNLKIIGATIIFALIIIIVGWFYVSSQISQILSSSALPSSLPEKSSLDDFVLASEILTAGSRGSDLHVAAVYVNYSGHGLSNYSLNITTYDKKIPSEVFILVADRHEAETYEGFLRSLRSFLGVRKIVVNEITIDRLQTIPQGAIVIAPVGVMSEPLLRPGILDSLADRGVALVYMGQPFTQVFRGGQVIRTPQEILDKLSVSFDESSSISSSSGFHLFQPLYKAMPKSGWGATTAYGSVSILYRGDGALIFVPQTLDRGWRDNYTLAAEDISKIVIEAPWTTPNSVSRYYSLSSGNYSGVRYFFSSPFKGDKGTVRLDFAGTSAISGTPIYETLYTYADRKVPLELYYKESGINAIPTNITNEKLRVNARPVDTVAPQRIDMALLLFDVNGSEQQSSPQGEKELQADNAFDLPIFVDRGEYILRLMDPSGGVYAQSYLGILSLDIVYRPFEAQKRSEYVFDLLMGDQPLSESLLPRQISIVVDKGKHGTYTFSGVSKVRVDVGSSTNNEPLPTGAHTFDFSIGGTKASVPVNITPPDVIFLKPGFWGVIILAVIIVVIGYFFARQDVVSFYIDVPDFPAVSLTKLSLSPETILSIFEKVNSNYHWQNTFLTVSEIKNGFQEIFYKGKPIYVTDYNVEYLLDQLAHRGLVKESLNYYGLSDWEKKANHSADYLGLMRRLRDICVNTAIPFTQIGESTSADSELTVLGQQIQVHFFENSVDVSVLLTRLLSTVSKGISILVLKSESTKMHFNYSVLSSSSPLSVLTKLECENGSIFILSIDELEKKLLEFKGM